MTSEEAEIIRCRGPVTLTLPPNDTRSSKTTAPIKTVTVSFRENAGGRGDYVFWRSGNAGGGGRYGTGVQERMKQQEQSLKKKDVDDMEKKAKSPPSYVEVVKGANTPVSSATTTADVRSSEPLDDLLSTDRVIQTDSGVIKEKVVVKSEVKSRKCTPLQSGRSQKKTVPVTVSPRHASTTVSYDSRLTPPNLSESSKLPSKEEYISQSVKAVSLERTLSSDIVPNFSSNSLCSLENPPISPPVSSPVVKITDTASYTRQESAETLNHLLQDEEESDKNTSRATIDYPNLTEVETRVREKGNAAFTNQETPMIPRATTTTIPGHASIPALEVHQVDSASTSTTRLNSPKFPAFHVPMVYDCLNSFKLIFFLR
jgi:hypothetical protein